MDRNILARVRCLSLIVLGLTIFPGVARCRHPTEAGLDMAVTYLKIDDRSSDAVRIQIPVAAIRGGWMVSDRLQFEQALGYQGFHVDDGGTWSLGLASSLLFDLGGADGPRGAYIRAQALADLVGGRYDNDVQTGLAFGVGARFRHGEYWGTRLEGRYTRRFESDDSYGRNDVGFHVGLSAFIPR